MKIDKFYLKGEIRATKEEIFFSGTRFDISGSYPLDIAFKVNYPANFYFYKKRMEGTILKINKKSVLMQGHERTFKVSIEELIEANRYPTVYYRLESIESKLGPFQSTISSAVDELLLKRKTYLTDRYYDFPSPFNDEKIKEDWIKYLKSGKEFVFFACLTENCLEYYFGKELIECLLNNGFIIRKLQKGYDFKKSYYGTNQLMLIE